MEGRSRGEFKGDKGEGQETQIKSGVNMRSERGTPRTTRCCIHVCNNMNSRSTISRRNTFINHYYLPLIENDAATQPNTDASECARGK